MNSLSVRELSESDIPLIIRYWLESSPDFLTNMGVDLSKMPSREQWEQSLMEQLSQSIPEKQSYCIIWELDGVPVGHSNINKIQLGEAACMHLHIWKEDARQKGIGTELVKMTLPFFFENYRLKTLFCEPYALNPAPNRTLEKIGFELLKTHITTPGWLNFEQSVNLWALTSTQYQQLK